MDEENSCHSRPAKAIPAVRVRRARASDLPALAALYDQLHLKNYMSFRVAPSRMRAAFERIARSRNHHLLVAQVDGQVAGTLHLIVVPHLGHGLKPMAVVENVVVAAERRSMGIGEAMIEGPRFALDRTPLPATTRGPRIGEHTAEVLANVLGLSEAEIAGLGAAGILV